MGKHRTLVQQSSRRGKTPSVEKTWKRLEKWFLKHLPEAWKTVWKGITSVEIQRFERTIGDNLPVDVGESYCIHNGQDHWPDIGVIFGLELLSLGESLEIWEWWKKDNEATDPRDAVPYEGRSFPQKAIKGVYSNSGWIPLAADAGSNYLGIDLDPDEHGSRGQVINFGRDEQVKCVLAPSWGHFLADMVEELENGNFVIDETSFQLAYPKSGHFFNNCMGWSRAKLGLARLSGKNVELWKWAGWDRKDE